MAAAIRSLPMHPRSTRTSEERRARVCFRTFPPGSFPGAPPGSGRGTRPSRPRRSGDTQWCRCGAAASEGAPEGRRTGWRSLRDSDPCGCWAAPRACGVWGEAREHGGLRAPPAPEARTPCVAQYTVWLPCPAVPGGPSPHSPSETRQRCCVSRSVARLLCNPAPLTARVSRLCLPMASTDRFAFLPGVCLGTGTPFPCLPLLPASPLRV